MRRPLVAGNWKMYGSKELVERLSMAVASTAKALSGVDVAVFPPAVFVPVVADLLAESGVECGAQNIHVGDEGAFTGEVSSVMFKAFGCRMVLVGHSERRTLFAESDDVVAAKYEAVQAAGMTPVLCVGEVLEEREAGKTNDVVAGQIQAVIDRCGIESFSNAVLAYEPVWAIGTGKTATPGQAQEVHSMIRRKFESLSSREFIRPKILYGGSVKPDNAVALFKQKDIDGGLIGGASLDAVSFDRICRAAWNVSREQVDA